MLSLPPYVLLVPYALFLLGYVFFSLANLISLGKYGARNAIGFFAGFVFIGGSVIVVFLTWQSLATVDWIAPVPLAVIPALSY